MRFSGGFLALSQLEALTSPEGIDILYLIDSGSHEFEVGVTGTATQVLAFRVAVDLALSSQVSLGYPPRAEVVERSTSKASRFQVLGDKAPSSPVPPERPEFALRWLLCGRHRLEMIDDLAESYEGMAARHGGAAADRWYRWQVVREVGFGLVKGMIWIASLGWARALLDSLASRPG